MSELNAKRLKEAEGDLLIADGEPLWLRNTFSTLAGSVAAQERGLLAVVYFIMYESGFYFMDGPHNETFTYNIKVMRSLCDPNILLKYLNSEDSKYVTVFSHNLLYPKSLKVVSYIVPTNNLLNPLLVVNLLLPEDNQIKTFLLPLGKYISIDCDNLILNQTKLELSLMLKNYLYSTKSNITDNVYHPHHLLSLPLHILQKLCCYLNGKSFVKFVITCRYLYEAFFDDEIVWKCHSLNDFKGFNKGSNETWKTHYVYQAKKKRIFAQEAPVPYSRISPLPYYPSYITQEPFFL